MLQSHLKLRAWWIQGSPGLSPITATSQNRPASCLPPKHLLILRQVSALSGHFWSHVAHQPHKGVCHRARHPRHVCRPRASRARQSAGSIGPVVRPCRSFVCRFAFRLMWAFQGNYRMWFGWAALVNVWLFVINPGNGHDLRAKSCCDCDCWGRAAVVGSLKWFDEFANSCWIIKTLTKMMNYVKDNPSLLVDFFIYFFTALSGDQGRIGKLSFFITLKSWVIFISVKSLYFSSQKSIIF